jgi:L-2-hydroxyglutarate oxidase LhgO
MLIRLSRKPRRPAPARTGKLIVATTEPERAKIEAIHAQGSANGVEGSRSSRRRGPRPSSPSSPAWPAILSPRPASWTAHGLMLALLGDIEAGGGAVAFGTPVERLARELGWEGHFAASTRLGPPFDAVVNAAHVGAEHRPRDRGYPGRARAPSRSRQGQLLRLPRPPAFGRLIYPAPVEGGLGIHVTLDLAGRMRFGPDVQWVEGEDYDVDPTRAEAFYAAIRTYWPGLPDGALVPDYAGVRPKLTGPGEPAADSWWDGPADHGLPGPRPPVRHREPGPHLLPVAGGGRGRPPGGLRARRRNTGGLAARPGWHGTCQARGRVGASLTIRSP